MTNTDPHSCHQEAHSHINETDLKHGKKLLQAVVIVIKETNEELRGKRLFFPLGRLFGEGIIEEVIYEDMSRSQPPEL